MTARNALGSVSEEKRQEILDDLKAEYNKRMGPDVLDPNSFEVMIITAVKP